MTHPTKGKGTIGYQFWQPTYYSPHHLGLDLFLSPSPLYAHLDSWVAKTGFDAQIGNYIILKDKNGKYVRYCHLSRIDVGIQNVTEGQQLGVTGNTGKMGTVTYANHLHTDIWHAYPNVSLIKQTWDKNLLIDPEEYFKGSEEGDNMPLQVKERYKSINEKQFATLSNGDEITKTVGGDSPLFDWFSDYVIEPNGNQWLHIRDGKAKVVLTSNLEPKEAPFVSKSEFKSLKEHSEGLEEELVGIADKLGVEYSTEAVLKAIDNLKKRPEIILDPEEPEEPEPEPTPPTPEPENPYPYPDIPTKKWWEWLMFWK